MAAEPDAPPSSVYCVLQCVMCPYTLPTAPTISVCVLRAFFLRQDEPTTGLDARAAGMVMRAVRNTAATGRTVVCTIRECDCAPTMT
jgi:hypothetical protein